MSVWDVFWLIIMSFAFVAYLILLFTIITDLFRDRQTSGWVKAIWVVFLFILPLITSLVYLIVRGNGMAERANAEADRMQAATDSYIKQTAGTNSAAQIADAKKLLDEGTITQEEFDRLKAKALA
ncbi:SHOCT domain-containing protein [Nocardia cyriacigeorgica]|uniref:SHOCT domain-containing protein n=1 Tax=Nocardia cyriacigeorgica TaxID=135487 RepID=A0A6P1CSW8_9NOCA|nr:SHOCT domain-containing protein [Nocardia cyriacigeorgica]MBF6289883.1 SHOCT domain-containing protein [Nocardia cyriacigeorgica]MBF6428142.1 SHOCT domain-containing protein [Nocardia cyriacigeorgica]NEW34376.1 SHOCT domain-containing protein [Nocardia cyriacigeorgica]BDT86672.1 membrane protein [Nocardia cyriacigeorgica]BDU06181.1 membrane protein [Nocardia cyriacigeorgica]